MTKHHPVEGLSPTQKFHEAADLMIHDRLETMWDQRDKTLAGDADALHDMRVASRRLRAAMEIAAPGMQDKRFRRLLRRTKQLTEALGDVRDTDVLAATLADLASQVDESGKHELDLLRQGMLDTRTKHAATLAAFLEMLDEENYISALRALSHHASGSAKPRRKDASATDKTPDQAASKPAARINDNGGDAQPTAEKSGTAAAHVSRKTKKKSNATTQHATPVAHEQEWVSVPIAESTIETTEQVRLGQLSNGIPNGIPTGNIALPFADTPLPNGKSELPAAHVDLPNEHPTIPDGHAGTRTSTHTSTRNGHTDTRTSKRTSTPKREDH